MMRGDQHTCLAARHAMVRKLRETDFSTPCLRYRLLTSRHSPSGDGDFPIAAVTEIIDGRIFIAAHGNREMPIWGFDTMVRNRIPIIVDYLTRIQVK